MKKRNKTDIGDVLLKELELENSLGNLGDEEVLDTLVADINDYLMNLKEDTALSEKLINRFHELTNIIL